MQMLERGIDGGKILLENRTAFVAVSLLDRVADAPNAFLPRQHAADGEEAGLQDGVHPRPQAQALRDAARVDHEEAQALLDDMLLHRSRQMVPHGRCVVRGIDEDRRSLSGRTQDIQFLQKIKLVNADEIG